MGSLRASFPDDQDIGTDAGQPALRAAHGLRHSHAAAHALWTTSEQAHMTAVMDARRSLSHAGFFLLFCASLALTATAFAHRIAAPDPSPELRDYLSMGGTLDDICGESGAVHFLGACEACLISANALAPDRSGDAPYPFIPRPAAFEIPRPLCIADITPERSPPARAPPHV